MAEITENIAKNIILLRKHNKWTQQDLANRLSYSDKTISKWERGESVPDIEMLYKVAEVFDVDIDYLTKYHSAEELKNKDFDNQLFIRNLLILIMACVAVFLVSTVIFVYPTLLNPINAKKFWISYLFAIPVCSVLCHYYARKMNIWLMKLITMSVFVWSLITALYSIALILGYPNFWLLFIIGVPIQAAISLFFFWRKTF